MAFVLSRYFSSQLREEEERPTGKHDSLQLSTLFSSTLIDTCNRPLFFYPSVGLSTRMVEMVLPSLHTNGKTTPPLLPSRLFPCLSLLVCLFSSFSLLLPSLLLLFPTPQFLSLCGCSRSKEYSRSTTTRAECCRIPINLQITKKIG